MISGQAPSENGKGDCSDASVLGGSRGLTEDAHGQWLLPRSGAATAGIDPQTGLAPPDTTADGCTYPKYVPTLPDQFDATGVSWKAYMEDMEARPSARPTNCAYAGAPAATPGDTSHDAKVDLWARKHDPFLYFHSITDRRAYCQARDVAEGPTAPDPVDPSKSPLASDLTSIATTPAYSFLTPNLCDDAHDGNPVQACSDGGKGGLPRADEWAMKYVPLILDSPAFKKDGLLILTVDEGSEALACCGEPKSRNLPLTVDNGSESSGDFGTTAGRGGGQIGTVMISPFITPGTVDTTGTYNHYSYLRSMEDIFGIGATPDIPGSDGLGHLGYAGAQPADATAGNPTGTPVSSYGADIFTTASPPPALPELRLPFLLPTLGIGLLGGSILRQRRRRRRGLA